MVFLEPWAKVLLFLHLIAAVVALGSAIHLLMRFVVTMKKRPNAFFLVRMHNKILFVSYSVCMLFAALVYPTFRIRVRFEYFDTELPWATALFEIKEHVAAIAFFPLLLLYVLLRELDLRDESNRHYIPLCTIILVWIIGTLGFNAWCGWYLGTLRSV